MKSASKKTTAFLDLFSLAGQDVVLKLWCNDKLCSMALFLRRVPEPGHSFQYRLLFHCYFFRYNLDAGDPPTGAEWGDLTPIHTIPNWERLASPRALVSHFPYSLMPLPSVIYVMRNPKDIMVSSYYFHQMAGFLEDPGTFDEFMDKFLEGKVMFGKWTDHVKSWRNSELGDRIMYITYEEMVQDLPASLRHISDFLGCNLTEEVIQKIAEHCSFKSMQNNNMSNFSLIPKVYMDSDKSPFLRKGIAGDWKNHFSSEQLTRFTSVISKELEGESFSLPWSLD
uniref:Sulfotransferase n=1 Tax=Maylandia zebra TaxID=106582 RepID=A0A3P9C2C8_9CICH